MGVNVSLVELMVLLGCCIGVMVMLAVYLFLGRPAVENEMPVSDKIRQRAGLFLLALAVTFVYWVPILVLKISDYHRADFYYQIGIQLDLILIIPSFMAWLFSLLQTPSPIRMLRRWIPIAIPIIALITFVITENNWITGIIVILWTIYVVLVLIQYIIQLRNYHNALRQTYTDLTHRSLNWLYGMAAVAVVELALYILTYMRGTMLPELLGIQDLCTVAMGAYITYFVDRQSLLIVGDELANVESAEVISEKEKSGRSESWVDEMTDLLARECEEKDLYLNPDLDAAMLARAIGSNRTYLSEYFSACGTTFYGYINSLRIDYACHLMDESVKRITISELALKCGYTNVNTFRRSFVERKGYTPSQYLPKKSLGV